VSKIGIISNLHSHRNRRGMAGLREMIAGQSDVLHAEIEEIAAMPEILANFARRAFGTCTKFLGFKCDCCHFR